MIQAQEISFGYGGRLVLSKLNLAVAQGEIVSVLGPNGSGKSTLLRLLRGVLRPDSGEIRVAGKGISQVTRRAVARLIAVVPQTPQAPFSFTAREVVTMGRFSRASGLGGPGREDQEAVERALAFTDTHHLAERPVDQLSGGELQRVVLARALAQETPVLLLDEATSQLDIRHRIEVGELLLRLHRDEGKTVVQVTHDLDLAAEVSHRMLLLGEEGRTVAQGVPSEVLQPELLRRSFGVGIHTDRNPLTGAIRLTPMFRRAQADTLPLRVHVLCGGGSGAEVLRRLHVLGARLSAGPLNRGDTDHLLATALGALVAEEHPFTPLGTTVLETARAQLAECAAVVLAAVPWGPGNLALLDLANDACQRGVRVVLVAPKRECDFTHGEAWTRLQQLAANGAETVADAEGLLEVLEPLWRKATT